MRVVLSSSAAVRLDAARQFVLDAPPATELLVVGATRGAADDFVRECARERSATFGVYRLSLTQLAARLAAPLFAVHRQTPATALAIEAVAARAVYDAQQELSLRYFGPVADAPGFPRALARTLEELALAGVTSPRLAGAGEGASDLAALLERFEAQFEAVATVDRAAFLGTATRAAADPRGLFARCRLLLLDVAVSNAAERDLVHALATRAPAVFVTIPAGDAATERTWGDRAEVERIDPPDGGLDRVRRHLFAPGTTPAGEPLGDVELFSAPGEGREAVEIARRLLRESRSGVPFDRMAIALRAPQQYAGLLEHALERAGIPAYFERGTRRPHPAGRAFLALIACVQENLSARRFAEYLSLGQVPRGREGQAGQVGQVGQAGDAFPASQDEVFGAVAERADLQAQAETEGEVETAAARAFRAPWKCTSRSERCKGREIDGCRHAHAHGGFAA